MAGAKEKLQEVQDELNCRVCLDTYEMPKLLQCFHVYCKKCLVRLVRKDEQGKMVIPCPECKKDTSVSAGGVADLPAAFQINRLLDIVGESGEKPMREKQCCTKHKDEELKLYCEDCGILVCYKCVIGGGDHHNHQHGLLEEALKRYKDNSLSQAQVEKQMMDVKQGLQKLCECRDKILGKLNTLECELDDKERKIILMSQIQEMVSKRNKDIEKAEEKLKNVQSQLKSCVDFVKNTLDIDCHYAEVLQIKADVTIQIKELAGSLNSDLFGLLGCASDVHSMEIWHFRVPSSPFEGQQIPCKDFFAYPATSEIKTYSAAVLRLPTAFYYNALTGIILTGNFVKQRSFPDSMSLPHDVTLLRRSSHDYFRPPYGPPVSYLKSVGYGKEVGLPDGVQEVYDPYTQKNLILDHNTLKIIRDNRVPLPQKDFATPTCISVGSITDENMPAHLCFQAAIVKEAFDSAQSKARVCTLSFHGQNGHPGVDGTVGMDGVHGMDGTDFFGMHGMNGEDGNYGNNGGQGTNGQNGGSALLILSGSADELVVQGRDVFRFPLGGTKSEQVLLVDCHGGHGGRGGYGGRGGDGGNGGHGAPGKNVNFYGQEGGEGGDGGDGGDGGLGGHGGDAGDGGNSGNGGKCLIKTVDPRLLMLVEVDCMPGEPGAGVKGGGGGIGGYCGIGGRKGEGGIGAGLGTFTYYHRRHGRIGRDGNRGRSGGCGLDSKSGQRGQTGGILWVVCGPNGGPIKESSTRFSAMVEGLSVVPEFDGDIYEPNERIAVYNVIVRNTGGLDLPHGVSVFMPSSQTINFEATKFDIPNDVQAGEKYIIPFKFYGRLSDLAPPNKPGPQTFEAEFRPRIELLGRPFIKKSRFKFLVQYPIQLGDLLSPEMMGQGEVAVFSIEVKNNSNLQYGTCEYSGGRVVLHLHFDSRLIPLGKITADAHAPYVMTYDHSLTDSTFIEILELPPNQSVIVSIKVQMESHAELFDQCPWQADLHLRDKLVEYNHNTIRRVTLTYNPQKIPADVLLVMSEVMTRQELDFWYHVFHLLGVSFDIWDTALYGGFSVDNRTGLRHTDTWYGRYHGKLILYPHCNNLQLLAGVDIAHHFHGVTFREQPLQELDSSLVIFMPLSEHNEMEMLRHLAEVHPNIEVPEHDYSGSHLTKPGLHDSPAPYKNCERRLVKRIEESNLSQAPLLLSRRVNIMHINLHKYSYGWVDIRQVPILKSSKFLLIDDSECYDTTSSSSDAETDAEFISLANRYGQTILAILCGISIPAKLKFIKKETSKPNDIVFYLPNASIMGIEELAMVTLAWEVADELFSLSGEAYRMKQLYSDIVDNTLAYVECGRVVLRGLKLIEKELKNRISAGLQHHLAKQAHGKITEMCKGIQKILSEAGVNNSKLKDMPSLDQLQDCSCIHRCHQHFVKDEQWNLAEN